jgi:hypothetical protein
VNRRKDELTAEIRNQIDDLRDPQLKLIWVSPLEKDRFREYHDRKALQQLGLSKYEHEMTEFWPSGGPHWDALAIAETRQGPGVVLVEAKSYPTEMFSSGSDASERSLPQIKRALAETREKIGVSTEADWLGPLYQSANRLAFLHFLRNRIHRPAWLVNVYFTDDPVPERTTTRSQWDAALRAVKEELGIQGLDVPYTGEVFLRSRERKELKVKKVPEESA